MVASWTKAKPRLSWVCRSLMTRTLAAERAAKGARAAKMESRLLWGCRFRKMMAGEIWGGEEFGGDTHVTPQVLGSTQVWERLGYLGGGVP